MNFRDLAEIFGFHGCSSSGTKQPKHREAPYLGLCAHRDTGGRAIAADGAKLHYLAPPCGLFIAEKFCFFAAREIEIERLVLLKDRAVGPTLVLFEVSGFLMVVDQGDFLLGALDDLLGLESEGGAGGGLGRNLIGDLGEQQNEYECSRKKSNFLHDERASWEGAGAGPPRNTVRGLAVGAQVEMRLPGVGKRWVQ